MVELTFAEQKSLDYKRLVESGVLCRGKFARLFNSVSVKKMETYEINCKSWRCKKHRQKWGKKWQLILAERLKTLPINLLVNLTTSEMFTHVEIFQALRLFMWTWRKHFGPTEYIKVVEYNKNHTQPHFHILFSCPGLKMAPMPAKFREPEWKKLSWPTDIFHWIQSTWAECLAEYAPGKKRTTVVWCQPPGNSEASVKYAVNYVTGKDKNEEPDETWRGRKLTYSKKFFDKKASQVWKEILIQMFGPPDYEDRFFWLPNDEERIIGESPAMFANNATLKRRYFEAMWYFETGAWPVPPDPARLDPVFYDITDTMQEIFNSA